MAKARDLSAPELSETERLDWLRLIRSQNVGPITFAQLLARYGSAGAALEALPELARRGGGGRAIRVCTPAAAEKEIAALTAAGGTLIARSEPGYPKPLAAIPDAPPLLAVLGHAHLLARPMVAMVGARNGSANGQRFAETLARDLALAELVVVSGMARGIDAAAHRGAIEGGTVAVMAGGADVVYPRENAKLYDRIREAGVVISEQPFGLAPQARHFPYRNRIVSGLAHGVVVIEATLRSGSLITARLAGEQGREVMAVPGTPLDPRARGTNKLIREGAQLVEGADDVLVALAGALQRPCARDGAREPEVAQFRAAPAQIAADDGSLNGARESVENLLSPALIGVDELVRASDHPPHLVAAVLLELELAGRLQRHPGGQVSLAFE